MNSYGFFIYEFICFMNSYMNSGVPRFQMYAAARRLGGESESPLWQACAGTGSRHEMPAEWYL